MFPFGYSLACLIKGINFLKTIQASQEDRLHIFCDHLAIDAIIILIIVLLAVNRRILNECQTIIRK